MQRPKTSTVGGDPTLAFLQSEGEMARRIAAYPWDSHPLGPLSSWPQSLRTSVSLILSSRQPMWIGWGPQMSFLYNDAYVHVLGLAKHPWALGRPAEEVWAEIWDFCGPLAAKVFLKGEASFVDDVRLIMRRGELLEETFYSFSYSPIRAESGEVAGLFCPSNDVTPKVVGARRLRTLSQLAGNAFLERETAAACASAAATLAKNPDDVPFAAIYLTTGDASQLSQCVGIDASDPLLSVGASVASAIADVLATGRPRRLATAAIKTGALGPADRPVTETLVLPMAGRAETRPLGALVAGVNPMRPFDDEHRTFFELVASNIGTAIQNALAAEEEKKRADMLAEMDRAKTVFFSNVSHEFRTPLTLMLGPLDRLAKTEDGQQRMLAQTARRNALRLLKLVNTLLEFSRLEAGRNDALFAPTDLAALTRDIASSFRSAIESAGLHFSVETELYEPVYVDPSMWERIVLNLLSNALKFTFEGEIGLRVVREGANAVLSVSDSGVGIASENLASLFERFHRVRGTLSRTHEGSGIGLALVKELAELHGGRVSVTSTLGRGTTFTVRIPLGSEHLDASRVVADANASYSSALEQYLAEVDSTVNAKTPPRQITAGAAVARPSVLLADDNPDLREYVSGILSERYDVTAVSNGREALGAARNGAYGLIVSDVMMPEMDGFELLRAIRADDRLAATPFVMLSARAGEEASLEGLLSGADDYVVKPFSAEELLARVHAQINASAIRERANRALRASEERFRTLASSLPYIVFEADAGGLMTFLSDEFAKYTAVPSESGYGAGWLDVVAAEDAAELRTLGAAAVASGETLSSEIRLRRHDGAYRWFAVRAIAQRAPEGPIERWIGTMTDVHDQRQAARERDFLSRASEVFARQVDFQATLDAMTAFAVPEVADWCQIHLGLDDGRIRTVAIAHRDPGENERAQQVVGRAHFNPEADYGTPRAIRTGAIQLLADVPRELVEEVVDNSEEVELYASLGTTSCVIVPLIAEDRTLGVLALNYGVSGRRYSADDLPMLEELGRRAGLAINKARLFEREHRVAESFQRASLPAVLPRVPGLTLDAFYAPGRAEAQVGGDWYDALRLLDGRVVLSIGDVAGSGLDAAVTMGNMRQIIRGIAQVHADPALMLDAADRALRLEYPDKFATAFVGVFDPITMMFTYASAGHPPPLLLTSEGAVEALSEPGLPLGLRAEGETTYSSTVELVKGSQLVLYTDGLTEFDREPESGERRLREIIADPSLAGEKNPARAIVQRVMNDVASRDDVAVLVVGIGGSSDYVAPSRWSLHTGDHASAGAARTAFARELREHGGSPDDIAAGVLVFGELFGNTVRYAPGNVEVIVDWSGAEPVLHVLDEGPGFRHVSILPPELMSESGRGLFIASVLTHDFRVSKRPSGGSHARAVLRLEKRQLRKSLAGVISDSPFTLADRILLSPHSPS